MLGGFVLGVVCGFIFFLLLDFALETPREKELAKQMRIERLQKQIARWQALVDELSGKQDQ